MSKKHFVLALLASSAICGFTPAMAQGTEQPADAAADEGAEDAPRALTPEEAAAKTQFLEAQVQSLQEQLDGIKKQMTAVTPSWKGAPQFEDKDSGFSFKPHGLRSSSTPATITNPATCPDPQSRLQLPRPPHPASAPKARCPAISATSPSSTSPAGRRLRAM